MSRVPICVRLQALGPAPPGGAAPHQAPFHGRGSLRWGVRKVTFAELSISPSPRPYFLVFGHTILSLEKHQVNWLVYI